MNLKVNIKDDMPTSLTFKVHYAKIIVIKHIKLHLCFELFTISSINLHIIDLNIIFTAK